MKLQTFEQHLDVEVIVFISKQQMNSVTSFNPREAREKREEREEKEKITSLFRLLS
jgi:hypothetical protein